MKVIVGWVVAILTVIGAGVGVVSTDVQTIETTTCNSPSACIALAASSSPARRIAVPVVPGARFHEGAVVVGNGALLGDHGTDEAQGWEVQMSYSGPGGHESLYFSADAASEQYASLASWRACQPFPSMRLVRCLLVVGTPVYYLVSPGSVWLTGVHDGVFFLLQTSRPASLPEGDFGPSPTRAWLFGVMASVYGS